MSAILSADDLNDFISPGVACIKPIETLPPEPNTNPYEVTTEEKLQAKNPAPASISLTDCLACSGCVTSAEAVLVSLQSHTEVLNTLDSHPPLGLSGLLGAHHGLPDHNRDAKLFIATVSPQVRASIGATFGLSERQAGFLIEQFLSGSQGLRLGGANGSHFQYVVDTNVFREACLVLGTDEVAEALAVKNSPKPILTSACPGWICYAEKTHPHVLPHLSKLKSPQALGGTFLKSVLSKRFNIHPSQIWHLAIMPCFDKKLEASRAELTDHWWSDQGISDTPVRDVDCVITSRELLSLASARGIQLATLPLRPLSSSEIPPFPDQTLSRHLYPKARWRSISDVQQPDAGTSGGYLYHVLKTYQSQNPNSTITMQRGRNADVVEYHLISSTGNTILKTARYYGFRNIQNLVRKLKPTKISKLPGATSRRQQAASSNSSSGTDLAYAEVMACPGGCTNGGGQLRIEDVASVLPETRGGELVVDKLNPQSQREWLARVDETYFSAGSIDEESHASSSEEEASTDASEVDSDDLEMTDIDQATDQGCSVGAGDEGEDDDLSMDDSSGAPGRHPQIINGINPTKVHATLKHWSQLVDIPLEKLVYTSFRKVESDVGKNSSSKNLDDASRIAAVAGLQGGGW